MVIGCNFNSVCRALVIFSSCLIVWNIRRLNDDSGKTFGIAGGGVDGSKCLGLSRNIFLMCTGSVRLIKLGVSIVACG